MIIKNIMKHNPVCVTENMSLTDVKAIMTKENVTTVPVLDNDSNMVGVLSKDDLMKADPSAATTLDIYEIGYLLSKIKAKKIMEKNVITVQETEVVEEVARIMADKDLSALPVMAKDMIVGMINKSDIFHAMTTLFGAWKDGVRATFELDEKPGQMAILAQSIADLNGNIVSIVTSDGIDVNHRQCTCKVQGITKDQLQKIIIDIGAQLEDIR